MLDTRMLDAPVHPLGLVVHPEWDAVRDRWNALWCNKVLNERHEFRDQKEGGASASSSGSGRA